MAATVLLAACSSDTTSSEPPALVEAAGGSSLAGTVGALVSPSPSFEVKDASGHILGGVAVSIAVSDGAGTLRNSPARTAANGPTSIGQWTLGTKSGRNAITVTAGSLPPMTIEVAASPGPPVALAVVTGDGQSSRAGDHVTQSLGVKVVDQYGNGVTGVPVTFVVSKGGGTITQANVTSDEAGLAGGVNWTLGRLGGEQEVQASAQLGLVPALAKFTAQIQSDYNIVLRFFGPAPATDIAATFTRAANRIHGLIVGDIPDITMTDFDVGRCGVPGEILNEVVDDVIVYATVTAIDGPGKILGSAGPCIVRSTGRLAVIGVMRFDVDDLNNLATSGRLEPVILHEMLHIVGVGSLWRSLNLVEGSGTVDPRYVGTLATARCNAANGQSVCGASVPIENSGSAGTIEVHWRESTFDAELMTGFAEAAGVPMPLSLITAASLEDYGYVVNYLATDPYAVPLVTARVRRPPAAESQAPWERLEDPLFDVTPSGWIRPVGVR
jgi:hypothetical protein